MQFIYYATLNLITIVIAVYLAIRTHFQLTKKDHANLVFIVLLWFLAVMCVCDIVAVFFEGTNKPLAHEVVYHMNALYFFTQCFDAYLWAIFFLIKTDYISTKKSVQIGIAVPFLVFLVILIANPLNHYFFFVNDQNIYQRGSLIFIHWIVELFYVLIIVGSILRRYFQSRNKAVRLEYLSYMVFFIPFLIGSFTQIFVVGISTVQIGVILASAMIYNKNQSLKATFDSHTGVKNRRALYNHEVAILGQDNLNLTIININIDNLDYILSVSDNLESEYAIKTIAHSLANSLEVINNKNLILFRYANDEFLIIGTNVTKDLITLTKKQIHKDLDHVNGTINKPYKLTVSIGIASAPCKTANDFDYILNTSRDKSTIFKNRKLGLVSAYKPL